MRVLIVDPDPNFLTATRDDLMANGHQIQIAHSIQRAIAIMNPVGFMDRMWQGFAFDVIFTSIERAIGEEARRRFPECRIVIIGDDKPGAIPKTKKAITQFLESLAGSPRPL